MDICWHSGDRKENTKFCYFTVLVSISEHGMANGSLENSSITVNIYLLFVTDGNGPLKSMFNRSNGCVAFMI